MKTTVERQLVTRALTTLVAVLCLLAQISSFSHLLLVRHVTCLEHGELVHESESGAHDRLVQPVSEHNDAFAALQAADATTVAEDSHDHCAAVLERRQRVVLSPVAVGLTPPPGARPFMFPAADAPCYISGRVLLQLAPKSSPPA